MRRVPLFGFNALIVVVMLVAAGCFNLKRTPPPTSGASIAGTIAVTGVSGAVAVDPNIVRQERVDVALAGSTAPHTPGVDIPVPVGREGVLPARHTSKLPLEWRAGDVLVMFDNDVYDRHTLQPVVEHMVRAAGLGIDVEVQRCTAGRYCKVNLKTHGALLDKDATAAAALALEKSKGPHIRVVARDMKKQGFFTPNDPLFNFQWHYDFIHMQAAWDIEQGDPNLVIAIVDSGAVTAHPDLQNRWARDNQNRIAGTDMVESGDNDSTPGRDTDPEDPGDNLFGNGQSSWHGTHIAGTIGAETNNGEGVAGITIKGKLLPVRVLGNQLSGFDADIMDGILWAIGKHVDGSPDNVDAKARVINLSLGGPTDDQSQTFWNDNMAQIFADPAAPIVVAAAGNSDEDASGIVPANVPGMITVGAVAITGLRASYSNFGDTVDIMAPGGDQGTDANSDGQPDTVLSTVNPDYDWRDGTSMACPHVTGVAALILSAKPTLKQADVEGILKASADTHGKCNEGCGAGFLDAVNALLQTGGQVQANPQMTVDVTQANFATGIQSKQVNVLNLGNAPFSFSALIDGPQSPLFSVTPSSGTVPAATDPNPRVVLTITLARGAFQAGSANLKLKTTDQTPEQDAVVDLNFNDDPNRSPKQIQNVQVGAFKRNADGSLEVVAQAIATRDSKFAYEIKGLRAGDYLLYAVGDDNNDGTYAADHESFGAYPTRDSPTAVHVGSDAKVVGIDFGVDAAFITGVVGGVGAPCNSKNDCTFLPDADCIPTFAGGYCSRVCDDGQCGNDGSCETLQCTNDQGQPVDCNVCLARCASDAQCRFSEGYTCDRGECVPAGF